MEEPQATVDVPQVTFKKRGAKAKSTIRKRAATPPPDDSDSGFITSEDEEGRQIKRRRKNAGVIASSTDNPKPRPVQVEEKSGVAVAAPTNRDDATKAVDWYDEDSEMKVGKTSKKQDDAAGPDGIYKGTANYSSFIQKNPDRAGKQVGPLKQSSNLDKEWEIDTKGKKVSGKTVASANRNGQSTQDDEDDEKLLESIPFACIICKKAYANPIVTKCGHYFCEACALKRYRKDPSCAACGTGTGGVFNVAKKLNRLLERKRERERQKREAEEEVGE
ncbi:RNA-splicing factor [Elasticomyces elasticus]|uniref:Pre-mRNA-splicing factor CWC24 n=1 Tax=Exophiala sideris TaxID=1016849 RepID=A0ABR0JGF7_9EURO|nr:RNA-splicing factor [Elasticomyces elasticus]KAK5032760.1 RNA-splicing factor [Exophiala sideris]KAK5062284.1 RNA-splicing factor [Exophiala sideris]